MVINWDRYRVQLKEVGRSRWSHGITSEPLWDHDPFVQEDDLWCLWGGRGKVQLRQGWAELRPGICLWMRPGWAYHIVQDPQQPIAMGFVHFELLDGTGRLRSRQSALPPEWIEPPDPQFAEAISRRVVEMCFGFGEKGYSGPPYRKSVDTIGVAAFTALLMELDEATDRRTAAAQGTVARQHDRLIRQVALRIAENPQNLPSVATLAREHHYSPDHFTKMFKAVTGQTPELYAIHARIRRGQQLLRETTLPVGQVGAAVGYRDIYFFSRQFKQFTKLSPRQYRRRHQR